MEIFIIDAKQTKEIYDQILEFKEKVDKIEGRQKAVVVDGEQLTKILKGGQNEKIGDKFVELVELCDVVLACRVSPK